MSYRDVSYWLETCGDDLTPRPPLDGSCDADVAILGAGFSGLWTAYYLLRAQPNLRVVVLEAETVGFGASGRNGAWCTSDFGAGPGMLAKRFGADAARRVQREMIATVDEIGRVCAEEGIDAQYQRDGQMVVARGDHQLPPLARIEEEYRHAGLDDYYVRLSAGEARDRIAIDGVRGALFHSATAAVHPGRLVRGLARAVERRGGVIYEGSPVVSYAGRTERSGAQPYVETPRGRVRAEVVVLAGEAYLSRLRPLHRALIPIYSFITLTEPLSPDQLESINWTHRTVVNSCILTVDYLSRTADGRILFGGRGAPYHFGSRIAPEFDRDEATFARLRAAFAAWFPALADVRFTHAWGGCLGIPRDFTPIMRYERAEGIATARGYTGVGVAATNLSGRVLADLVTGTESELTELPMTRHHGRNWEVEPLRVLATRFAQWGAMRIDAKAERTGVAPSGRSLTERLIGH